jgi:hypothetical protein
MQFLHRDSVEQFVEPGFSKGLTAAALILFAVAVGVYAALPQPVLAVGLTAFAGHAAQCGPYRAVARVDV